MNREDLIKAGLMLAIIAAEWWAMQPYHEPVMAKIFHYIARFCYSIARHFGSLGLMFEHAYYEVI